MKKENSPFYNITDINNGLRKRFNAKLINHRGDITLKAGKVDLDIGRAYKGGALTKKQFDYMTNELSQIYKEDEREISNDLLSYGSGFDKKQWERVSGKAAMIVALFGAIFFTITKGGFTGNAIANISNTTSNIGFFVCILAVIVIVVYQMKGRF